MEPARYEDRWTKYEVVGYSSLENSNMMRSALTNDFLEKLCYNGRE